MLLLRLRITNCAQLDMRVGWYFWHMLMHNNALFSPMFIVQLHVIKVQHKCTNVHLCAPDNPPQRSWRVALRRRLLRNKSQTPLLCRGVATGASGLAQTVCKATLVHVCAHTSTPRHIIGVLRLLLKHRYWKKGQDKTNHIGHQTTWICRTSINSCI